MVFFASTPPPSQQIQSALRLPAQKRISVAASQRLSTITEGSRDANGNLVLPDSPRRVSAATSSQRSIRTGPWRSASILDVKEEDEYIDAPADGEKLAQLRQDAGGYDRKARGGWLRLSGIVVVVLIVIALAVGLGVGLTRKKHTQAQQDSSSVTPAVDDGTAQAFPLGEYSMVTQLRTVNTNCTSNAATWRCYPYVLYDPSDPGTKTSSMATFNWVISNTSATYATKSSTTNDAQSANLTISSTNNPFAVSFTNQSLTYVSTPDNLTSDRYTFSFDIQKPVAPSASITDNNAATLCLYNSTFTGVLYADASRSVPSAELANSTNIGGYTQWPYAVEVTQTSGSAPECYDTVNGNIGAKILTDLTPDTVGQDCSCKYRNY